MTPAPLGRELLATLAVGAFSFASALALVRTFDGSDAVMRSLVIVVAGHATSLFLRRVGAPLWVTTPLVALALVVVTTWATLPATTGVFFLPSAETWDALTLGLAEVRDAFPTETAPVPFDDGWAVIAMLGVATVVLFTDTFAFGADARAETLVPGGLFFVFVSALGDGDGGIAFAGILVAAGVATVAALRARGEPDPPVLLAPARTWRAMLVPTTVGVAGSVAIIAVVVGPQLPGADAPPLVETTGRSGGTTEVVSPLVDIRSRLVDQSDQQVFVVRSTEDSYWRVTTLPEFDGTTFRLPTRSLERADGRLTALADRPGGVPIRQEIEIDRLGGQLVPAAADPVEASGRDLRWNPDTSTLVTVGDDLATGDLFSIVSSSPRVNTDQLRSVGAPGSPDPVHLDLPVDFPPAVTALAFEVAGDRTTAYDTALALQDWFRTEFDYSLEVQPGHGTSAIEDFLERRIGYCEQFAATFAAMGRTLGLPTRVAVGYTAGVRLPDGSYSVRGRHAHAWPEVWFGTLGWIPFEPTPGRGVPGTEQYTGVAPDQDQTSTELEEPEDADPDTVEPGPAPDQDPLIPDFVDPSAGQQGGSSTSGPAETGVTVPWRALSIIMIAVAIVAAPSMSRRFARTRRRTWEPERRVMAAWATATTAVERAGVAGRASMTPREWATTTARTLPTASRPMEELARVVDRVRFARPGSIDLTAKTAIGSDLVAECTAWSHQIGHIATDHLPMRRRVAVHFGTWS